MSAVLPNLDPLAQLQSPHAYPFWLLTITVLGLTGLIYRFLNRRNGEYGLAANGHPNFQPRSASQDRHVNNPSRDIASPTQQLEAEYSQTTPELKHLPTQLQGLADNLPGVIYHSIVTPDGKEDFSYISPGCRDLYGFEPEAMMQNPQLMWDAVLPEDLEGLRASIEQSKSTLQPWRWQGRIYTSQGTVKWIQGIARPELHPDGTLCWDGLLLDISDLKQAEIELKNEHISAQVQAEQALQNSEALLRLVTDNMRDLVCLHDPDGTYRFVSSSAKTVLGFCPADMIGRSPYEFFHPDDQHRIRFECHRQVLQGKPQAIAYRMRTHTGRYVWLETLTQPIVDEAGIVTQLQTSSRDVTERMEFLSRLEYEALHDTLTGLPNRKQVLQCLDLRLTERADEVLLCAVLLLDLDRFQVINDGLGHQVGDQVLVAIARKLEAFLPAPAMMARLSGDEFVIVLKQMRTTDQARALAGRILKELDYPLSLGDWDIFISASIGLVIGPGHYQSGAEMLRDADIALDRAKTSGKSRYTLFEPQMHANVLRQMHLENALRHSIERQDFELHYQPIVNLRTHQVCGFEALLRWRHRNYGLIAPMEFIPIAEETGLIIPLGNWVLNDACQQFSQWQQRYPVVGSMTLSINLSPVQIRDPEFIRRLQIAIDQSGIASTDLILEITESLLVENVEHNLAMLRQIRQMGPKLSMDDFGTGYSSLSYFQRFPFNCMKVDRSFVAHLGNEAENPGLVKAILALADSLDLNIIAEGIETEQQLQFLQQNNCQYGQGYWFYRPMTADQVEVLLKTLEAQPDKDHQYR